MLKKIGYGLIIWVVPYVSAIPMIELMKSDPIFFKTLMILIGGLVGVLCTIQYFKNVEKDFLKEGIILGLVWITLNWLLDYVMLIPFAKLTISRYFMEIGLRYLAMLAPTVTVGYVLSKKG